jgi:gliding motility associated protien GldN
MRTIFSWLAAAACFAPLAAQMPGALSDQGEKAAYPVLAYAPLREADVFWEKRIWREVDLRTVENRHFVQREAPFFQLVLDGLASGQLTGYREDDFVEPIPVEELRSKIDQSAEQGIDLGGDCPEEGGFLLTARDIVGFRVQEIYFFDKHTSRFQVRLVGLAPVAVKRDDEGDPLFEYPLCWLHYPDNRLFFAQHTAPLDPRSLVRVSWEDVFEAHFFWGSITQVSNEWDASLEELFNEEEVQRMSERIQQNLFDFEQDLWSD